MEDDLRYIILFLFIPICLGEDVIDLGNINLSQDFIRPEYEFKSEITKNIKETTMEIANIEITNWELTILNSKNNINKSYINFENSIFKRKIFSPVKTLEEIEKELIY